MTERWTPDRAAPWLRRPGAADDKYRRGVLGVRTGSAQYPGAAVLGVSAAWRTGVGLLRYVPAMEDRASPLGLPTPAAAVLAARPETVFGEPTSRPCNAWLMGSGTDPAERSFAEHEALLRLLTGAAPVVIDAGALDLVLEARERRGRIAPAILTPHTGEFERLWEAAALGALPEGWAKRRSRAAVGVGGEAEVGVAGEAEVGAEADADASAGAGAGAGADAAPAAAHSDARRDAARRLAQKVGATVLLKGSVTIAATPGGLDLVCGPATPWLASAGTGDVLAGILGALVAAHADDVRDDPELLGPIGITAALLHDTAARLASGDEPANGSGRPVTALDIAEAIPAVFASL